MVATRLSRFTQGLQKSLWEHGEEIQSCRGGNLILVRRSP